MPSPRSRIVFLLIALLSLFASPNIVSAAPKPVTASELMSLVAGEALPDNVVRELRLRGVQFHVDDGYRAQLKAAGAGTAVLDALTTANFFDANAEAPVVSAEFIRHLSSAGAALRARNFDSAMAELDAAASGSRPGPETAFVVAAVLTEMGDVEEAEPVLEEMLRRYPEFPEINTKLSFVFYALGDAKDGFSEAKAALLGTPDNAEAHKNAGLNLNEMHSEAAAIAEYRQALAAKSDYEIVRVELKKTLTSLGRTKEAMEIDSEPAVAKSAPKAAPSKPGSDN